MNAYFREKRFLASIALVAGTLLGMIYFDSVQELYNESFQHEKRLPMSVMTQRMSDYKKILQQTPSFSDRYVTQLTAVLKRP